MLAMIQPVMPLIEYQVNKEYIASVLCENRNEPALACNGKCYLEKQVKESQEKSSHEHSLPQIDFTKYPVSPIGNISYQFQEFEALNGAQFIEQTLELQLYSNSLFRPPIV